MTVSNWANWCMIIETFAAILGGALGLVWRTHKKTLHLKDRVKELEHQITAHGPRDGR